MRKRDFAGTLSRASVIVSFAAVVMIFGFAVIPLSAAKPVITDLSISDAVEDELLMDKAVPSYRIIACSDSG
jgi:hypothetical protein